LNVKERVDASKTRIGRDEALALARSAARVLVARGRGVVEFNMQKNPPDDDTLAAHLLGRTGNLRAPTIRVGRTLLVGFSEEGYRHVF
jgi:arsenate reductase-like glutaredoxin family protein